MTRIRIAGIGPLYWARERDADGKAVGTAWFAEATPPFRYGHAVRIRIGDKAVHLGLCRKSKKPFMHGVEKTPEEIGQWVYD